MRHELECKYARAWRSSIDSVSRTYRRQIIKSEFYFWHSTGLHALEHIHEAIRRSFRTGACLYSPQRLVRRSRLTAALQCRIDYHCRQIKRYLQVSRDGLGDQIGCHLTRRPLVSAPAESFQSCGLRPHSHDQTETKLQRTTALQALQKTKNAIILPATTLFLKH